MLVEGYAEPAYGVPSAQTVEAIQLAARTEGMITDPVYEGKSMHGMIEMVRNGELKAPVVIGRDHLDSGSVASPNRETEAMKDGSDAVSDWPLLNALLNTAGGATWVSLHHGGGVGMGYSQHSGVVIVADGTEAAAKRLARVLWNDPGTGVMRHADAGYEIARQCAREQGLKLPML